MGRRASGEEYKESEVVSTKGKARAACTEGLSAQGQRVEMGGKESRVRHGERRTKNGPARKKFRTKNVSRGKDSWCRKMRSFLGGLCPSKKRSIFRCQVSFTGRSQKVIPSLKPDLQGARALLQRARQKRL